MKKLLVLISFFSINSILLSQSFENIISSYPSGQPKIVRTYVMINSSLQPKKEIGFYESGAKQYEGTFKDGARDGQWTYFDVDGKRAVIIRFRDNQKIDERRYYDINLSSLENDNSNEDVINSKISNLNEKVSSLESKIIEINKMSRKIENISTDIESFKSGSSKENSDIFQQLSNYESKLADIAYNLNDLKNGIDTNINNTVGENFEAFSYIIQQIETELKNEFQKHKKQVIDDLEYLEDEMALVRNTVRKLNRDIKVLENSKKTDIPQTQQNKIPDPPARPSAPKASENNFFDEDITIEDTNADNFDFEAPQPPKKGPKIKFVPYDKKPEPKFAINPDYPVIAKEAGIEGIVYIEAGIDEKGNVVQAAVLKGVPNTGLDEAALEAVLRSKWRPASHRGKKVAVKVTIPIKFQLN